MKNNILSCIYTDGLTIDDPSMLSTLVLFYDKIYLPHPYDLNPEAKPLAHWPFKYMDKLEWHQGRYLSWLHRVKELIDAGIIEILPAPIPADNLPDDFNDQFVKMTKFRENYYSSSMVLDGYVALTVHCLFSNTNVPEWSLRKEQNVSLSATEQILANWFTCRIPCYGELHPEQILELREKLAPYQEGTRHYVNSKLLTLHDILRNSDIPKDAAIELLVKSEIETEMYDLEKRKFLEQIEFLSGIAKRAATLPSATLITTITAGLSLTLLEKFADGLEFITGYYKNKTSKEYKALQFIGKLESVKK